MAGRQVQAHPPPPAELEYRRPRRSRRSSRPVSGPIDNHGEGRPRVHRPRRRRIRTREGRRRAEQHLQRLGRFRSTTRAATIRRYTCGNDSTSTSATNPKDELRLVRLHLLHLLQTLSPNTADLDTGAPARGFHGEAYRGHIFWDELLIFPVLNMHLPMVTRTLLHYRYPRLPRARRAAAEAAYGCDVSLASGSDGWEESPQLHLLVIRPVESGSQRSAHHHSGHCCGL